MRSQSNTDDPNEYTDPSAIILPHIETDEDIVGGYDLEELVLFVPACILGTFALLAYFAGNLFSAGLLAAPAVFGGLLAMYFSLSSKWYAPPRERVRDWIAYLRSRRSLPWGHDQAIGAGPIHGVRSIGPDGTVECRDGRYALALPVSGTNADQVDQDTIAQLVGGLRTGVNIDLKDVWFTFYSTTRPDSNEARATELEDRVLDDMDSSLTPFQEAVLLDTANWLRETDEAWNANDWQDFIEIQVFPHEYDATQDQLDAARERDDDEGIWGVVSVVGETVDGLFDRGVDIPEDDTGGVRTPEDVLRDRVERVEDAVSTIDGVQLRDPSPATAADLLLEHWTGGGHVSGDNLEQLIAPERDVLGEFTPAERLLTPGHYDNVGTTMLVDDTLARTFWISDWPMEPDSLFLRDLHTMDEVNLSVRLIAQPEDKQDVIDELEVVIARARGEEQRREEKQEISSLAIVDDIDALERAYHGLQQTNAQPWRLSGYVTIRADSKSELKEASDEVKRTLESYPAGCTPIAHGTRQKETFAAGAPFAPDVFERETSTQKAYRALSGAFGTMFPFVRTSINDSNGVRWGRNTQTGQSLWADPFSRGTAPHLLTLGKSRSGKTYGVSTAVAEWWQAEDDRTLILCDTQGGFDGVTELLDGDHIVVDSSNGVNPFYIQSSDAGVETEQRTAFGLKVDEVTEFIAGILRAQDIDPGQYRPTIQLAVQETYKRFGISNEEIPETPDCPTIGDFLDTLDEMVESPEQFSHTKHEAVAERRKGRVADLLEMLTGFMESGKYSHLVDETSGGITADTRMAYLDLRHFEDATDAEKSVHLHLMLSQVSQLIKRTPGETIFLIDEAHLLLHSKEMLAYLQSATREWARYKAAMWFVSQSPQEFVRRSSATSEGQENHREVILEQCSTTQVFYCGERINPETLIDVGLFPDLVETAKRKLTPGKAGKGYSECLVQFDDETGWMRMHVEAPPLLDLVLKYKWHEHGDFIEYLRERAGEEVAAIAAESRESFVDEVFSKTVEVGADAGDVDDDDVEYVASAESVQRRTEGIDDALRSNGHAPNEATDETQTSDQKVGNRNGSA